MEHESKILRNKNFVFLLLGHFISLMGEKLSTIVFFSIAVTIVGTESSIYATLLLAVQYIPYFLFGYFFGTLADKVSKKLLLVIADLSRALAIIIILFVQDSLVLLYIVVAILGLFTGMFEPTKKSLIPFIVNREDLYKFNKVNAVLEITAMFLGLVLGTIFLSHFSVDDALKLNIATYLFSLCMVLFISVSGICTDGSKSKLCRSELYCGIKEGLSYVKSHFELKAIIVCVTVISYLGSGVFYAALSDMSIKLSDSGISAGVDFGYYLIILALGAASSQIFVKIFEFLKHSDIIKIIYLTGGVLIAYLAFLFFLMDLKNFYYIGLILFVCGIGIGANYIRVLYLIHHHCEKKYLGRVVSLNDITHVAMLLIGIIIGSLFIEVFDYKYGFLLAAFIYFMGYILTHIAQRKGLNW